MDELDKEMKMSFIDEARQLLEAAEQCFLDLESSGGGPDVIENLFRLAHNMKGTSRAVGFGEVAEFTHELENLLLKLKEGVLQVDGETVNLLLECNDHLKMMVEELSLDMGARFDSKALSDKIKIKLAGGSLSTAIDETGRVNAGSGNAESGSAGIDSAGWENTSSDETFSVEVDVVSNYSRVSSPESSPALSPNGHASEVMALSPSLTPNRTPTQTPLQTSSHAASASAEKVLNLNELEYAQLDLAQGEIGQAASKQSAANPMSSGGSGDDKSPIADAKKASTSRDPSAIQTSQVSQDSGHAKAQATDESIRVSLSRLEKLGDFIGELVILQTVLNQHRLEIPSQLMQRTIAQLGKLSKEIQDISMSLRMIPIKSTFQKLQRIVRDTSKTLGKSVELKLEGEQTEVDKTVLEQVADPLVHIVRNAIDHGLEMPDERVSSGKNSTGHVEIKAFHQGNSLVIEVRDDGKGIDPQRLVRKAIEKGILRPDQNVTDSDAFLLLFAPGFSTKDQVSEISGRGVGLDVVKTNVERLGGQVQLESEVGRGSCFRILLPLTLAIIDGMVVQVGDERYVVPIANVQESVRPRKEDIHFVTGKGEMLTLRDRVLPLFRLSSMLKINSSSAGSIAGASSSRAQISASDSIAIIVNSRKDPFAILVDDIIRQQQIVIKKLGAEIRSQKGLTGSAILGDGKPALILDLNDLAERMSTQAGAASFNGPSSARAQGAA